MSLVQAFSSKVKLVVICKMKYSTVLKSVHSASLTYTVYSNYKLQYLKCKLSQEVHVCTTAKAQAEYGSFVLVPVPDILEDGWMVGDTDSG